jgi:hypothetical protein
MSRGFDRLFGATYLSLQSLIVSVCLAFATFFLMLLLLSRYGLKQWDKDFLLYIVIYLMAAFVPFGLTYWPKRAARKKLLLVWMTWALTTAGFTIVTPAYQFWKLIYDSNIRFMQTAILIVFAAVLIALFLYAFFFVLIRLSLRRISTTTSMLKTSLILLINIAPVFGVYAIFKALLFALERSPLQPNLDLSDIVELQSFWANWGTRVQVFFLCLLVAVFLFDIVFVLSACIFAALSALMLLHRLFWPLLSRAIYTCQRYKIVSKGKVLLYVGALLILLGIGKIGWIREFKNLF